jgi:capsular exopolysaccharide synthesis family protein
LDGRLDAGEITSKVEVAPEGQSDIVSVRASDSDPKRAAELANSFAEQYIAFRRESDQSTVREAQEVVQRELARIGDAPGSAEQARLLRERAEQLETLASLQTGNAELVQPAQVPGSPSSPRIRRNAAVGVVLGLLVALLAALLAERFDRRIRDPEEIEDAFGRPNLGAIPDSRALAQAGPVPRGLPGREAEAFRMLRANLRYFNVDQGIRSILVTSAVPEEGKSTVVWNLACAAAGAGERVLVVEADLRRPQFADSAAEITPLPGLTDVLAGQATLDNVIQKIGAAELGLPTGNHRHVDVVVAGPLPPNPGDLIESRRMIETIQQAERAYDLVVIDSPPTSIVSDAIPLMREVSGVLVVARLGKTSREQVMRLRNQLANLDAPLLGAVVNSVSGERVAYGYMHGYDQRALGWDHGGRGWGLGQSGAAAGEEEVDQVGERAAGASTTATTRGRAQDERPNAAPSEG